MNYQEFLSNIKTQLSLQIDGDFSLTIQTFTKNNGTKHEGLIIQKPDLNVSPTIYLKPYYHRYLDGVSLEDICQDILTTYRDNLPEEDFDVTRFTDYHKASRRIVMRLISYEKNEELLMDVPHFHYLDLAVVFYCMLCSGEKGQANILIRNEHMKSWNVTADDLREAAEENTRILLPPKLISMTEIIEEHRPGFLEEIEGLDINMYILTNRFRTNGATVLLYDGLLKKLSGIFHSDLIILPSSIHEVILFPAREEECDQEGLDHYTAMVREVNEMELADEEILSGHAYYYCRRTGMVSYRKK